jgi:hypothetical protein
MKGRTLYVSILAAVALAISLAWFFWPRHINGPLLRLKIVRQTVEQGRPVVFFRVEVADHRRIQITGAEKVLGNVTERSWDEEKDSRGLPKVAKDFWAPSLGSPTGNPKIGRKQFGVQAPTNAPIWKLRVTIAMEEPDPFKRISIMPGLWKWELTIPSHNKSKVRTAWEVWNAFYDIGSQTTESDPITNTVPVR